MIRVVNKKEDESKIYKVSCDCGVKLECEKSDMLEGALGSYYIVCPECGSEVFIEEIEPTRLTEHNIEFPKHFLQTSKNAVNIDSVTIQKWIREGIASLKSGKAEGFWLCQSGNTCVIILEYQDEYVPYVFKHHWESEVLK